MDYPIIFLSPWLVHTITENVDDAPAYSNNLVSKGFIKYQGPGVCNIQWTPLVRVFKYISTTPQGELTAVLNESENKILALFTRECIVKFELEYSQRLTYNTVHSLIIIRRANLRFATVPMLRQSFGGVGGLDLTAGTEVVYLEILEIEVFHRDQFVVEGGHENRLRFVYGDEDYRRKFGADITGPKLVYGLDDSDGMVSDEEDPRLQTKP